MDTQEPAKPALPVEPEVPGLKEALARMKAPVDPPQSSFFQMAKEVIFGELAPVIFPTLEAMAKMPIVVKEPLALLTAIPYVNNMRMNRALGEISSIPEGKALVDATCNATRVELNCDPRFTGGANCFSNSYTDGKFQQRSNFITADGYTTMGATIGILIHEMHHERQLQNGVMKPLQDKVPSPVEQVWYERAMEADAQATAVDISWKLKEAGKPAAWTEMEKLGGWRQQVAEAYAKKAEQDPASVESGAAKREAFDTWFSAKTDNGFTTPQIYNRQALNNLPKSEDIHEMYKGGKPLAPITVADIEKLGGIAEINYLKLPGGKPLDSMDYRQADWNGFQGGFLHARHQQYDQIKYGTFKVVGANPAMESKFAKPASPCDSPKSTETPIIKAQTPIVQAQVSLKRPALKM
ncbi:MAG: hypothetical protein PSY14_02415 [bacterium]|nr:hypothetical protein [bacterium]